MNILNLMFTILLASTTIAVATPTDASIDKPGGILLAVLMADPYEAAAEANKVTTTFGFQPYKPQESKPPNESNDAAVNQPTNSSSDF